MGLAGAIYDQWRVGNKKFVTIYITIFRLQTHNPQQTTHKTKMDHCHPTLQQLCPLSPWVGQRHQQLMALLLPMGSCKARAIGLGGAAVGSPVWSANTSPIKLLRGRQGLGLRWPPINQDTQQSTQSWRKR
jgi:hypothetical protein